MCYYRSKQICYCKNCSYIPVNNSISILYTSYMKTFISQYRLVVTRKTPGFAYRIYTCISRPQHWAEKIRTKNHCIYRQRCNELKLGLGNVRPMGHMRPAKNLNVARELLLTSKQIFRLRKRQIFFICFFRIWTAINPHYLKNQIKLLVQSVWARIAYSGTVLIMARINHIF